MATKLENYVQMAGQTAAEITSNQENWMRFLATASKLYRYAFTDQLLIHAQRPLATACAGIDIWNKRMRRYVKRGTKGIGLVSISSGHPAIRYVFDVSDTRIDKDSRNLYLWKYKPEYLDSVTIALEKNFGIPCSKVLAEHLAHIATQLAKDYWKNYGMEIMDGAAGSGLEGMEKSDFRKKFCKMAAFSILYILLLRCGFYPEKYFSAEVFEDITDFNSQGMIKIIGHAVSQASGDVLHQIAIAIFSYEREKKAAKHTDHQEQTDTKVNKKSENHNQPSSFIITADNNQVSDIIFLQKRDTPALDIPAWVQTEANADGFLVNSYFLDNPHMVLGTPASRSTQYGKPEYTVLPLLDADLGEQLREAVSHIHGKYQAAVHEDEESKSETDVIPADPMVKNYSYTIVKGDVYYRENSVMKQMNLSTTTKSRVVGMINLRDCVHQLINLQMDECVSESDIKAKQEELNRLYDAYTRKYGLINDRANRLAFEKDSSYYLLCSLEILDDNGKLKRKADMFTRRTIKQQKSVTHVDTASEALVVSISERARVDLAFMSQLTGKNEADLVKDLNGVIYKDPVKDTWQTADEYLSGNVWKKLRQAQKAAEQDAAYQINVEALEAAQPKDLDASEIKVRIGATWIDKSYVQQFMTEILKTPFNLRNKIQVNYSKATAQWFISNKNSIPSNDVAARSG